MFEQYPKTKTNLPPEYQAIFDKHYYENREGLSNVTSITKRLEVWMHKKVALDVININKEISTLELGAGTLNHLDYEINTRPYDIVEPYEKLFNNSKCLDRIRNVYSDTFKIPEQAKYKRVISIATLEHLINLPLVVAKVGLLLTDDGNFRAGIPNEGTFLWKLGWKFTTGLEFKIRYNLNYKVIMEYEHVNTANEIEEVLKYFFYTVKCKVYGLSKKLGLYRFYSCFEPNIKNCLNFIKSKK